MVAVAVLLGGYGWALLVERWAGLRVDVVVQAVIVAAAFGRLRGGFDRLDWLVAAVVLPAASAGGVGAGVLLRDHHVLGGAVFTAAAPLRLAVRADARRLARGAAAVRSCTPAVAVLAREAAGDPVVDRQRAAAEAQLRALVATLTPRRISST